MKNDKIVMIKGRKYDSATGLPLPEETHAQKNTISQDHANIKPLTNLAQKSQLIYKKTVHGSINHGISLARKVGRTMDVARSKSVSHFGPKPAVKPMDGVKKVRPDIGPIKHPIIEKIENVRQSNKPNIVNSQPKSVKAQKEEAIAEAFKKIADRKDEGTTEKRRLSRFAIYAISLIAVILTGYLVYLYMPSFSVRIASAQAGISATYPEYCPDGYSISGPVSFTNGEVMINFHANTGNSKFSIKQSKSSWDSSALKAKVQEDSGNKMTTTNERGLTIFTYNNSATWVNGGILYTISGDAPLSGDQVRRIATSL